MTTKVILAIVAAVTLGFGATYYAANSGSCDGGCPISNMLGLSSSKSASTDCCSPGADCCDPPSACCGTAKVKSNVPDCCFPGSPCCEGPDCCLKKDKAITADAAPEAAAAK
jgi:hypothetical protein